MSYVLHESEGAGVLTSKSTSRFHKVTSRHKITSKSPDLKTTA